MICAQTKHALPEGMSDPDFVPRLETFRAPLPARIWLRRPHPPQPTTGRWSRLLELLGDVGALIGAAVLSAALFVLLVLLFGA